MPENSYSGAFSLRCSAQAPTLSNAAVIKIGRIVPGPRSFEGALQASAKRILTAPAGRSVTIACAAIGRSSSSSQRKRAASIARATSISVCAKWCPTQVRAPPPNGKCV
jgi:hypothetical protein